jgi:hypothetical protein
MIEFKINQKSIQKKDLKKNKVAVDQIIWAGKN